MLLEKGDKGLEVRVVLIILEVIIRLLPLDQRDPVLVMLVNFLDVVYGELDLDRRVVPLLGLLGILQLLIELCDITAAEKLLVINERSGRLGGLRTNLLGRRGVGEAVLVAVFHITRHELVSAPQQLLVVDGLILDGREELHVHKVSEGREEAELGLAGAVVHEEALVELGVLGVHFLEPVVDHVGHRVRDGEQDVLQALGNPIDVLWLLAGPVADLGKPLALPEERIQLLLLLIS